MDLRCPRCNEASTDPVDCSECGAPMASTPVAAAAAPAATAAPPSAAQGAQDGKTCPDCNEPRPGPQTRFCEVCRYDFVLGQSYAAPAANSAAGQRPTPPSPVAATTAAASLTPAASPFAPPQASLQRWELVAVADPALCPPGDEGPTDLRERIFPLDFDEHLIGRRSGGQGIHPEIPLADLGVSRRHARIDRGPDGSLSLLDLGSANGTRLNGVPVEPNLVTPLKEGDEIVLGICTRMKVRAR